MNARKKILGYIDRTNRQITFPGSANPKEISQQCTRATHTEAVHRQGVLLVVFYSSLWPLKGPGSTLGEGCQTSRQPADANTPHWGGGDNWSYKTCKTTVKLSPPTNKPTPSFLQAGCPSGFPTNSVKSLKGKGEKVSHSTDLLTPGPRGVFQPGLSPLKAPGCTLGEGRQASCQPCDALLKLE